MFAHREVSRENSETRIKKRLRISKYIQRSLVGIAVTAGVVAGPSDGLGENRVADAALEAAGVAMIAGATEKALAMRRCRKIVSQFAESRGSDAFLDGQYPVVLTVEDGMLVEKPPVRDPKADESSSVGGNVTRIVMRALSPMTGFVGTFMASRTYNRDALFSDEPVLYMLSATMIVAGAGFEFLTNHDHAHVETAFTQQLNNLETGLLFETNQTD